MSRAEVVLCILLYLHVCKPTSIFEHRPDMAYQQPQLESIPITYTGFTDAVVYPVVRVSSYLHRQ